MWDTVTGALVRTFDGYYHVWPVAFSSDGANVLSGSSQAMMVWEATSGVLVRTVLDSRGVDKVVLSADGSRVLWYDSDERVVLWDADTGTLLRTFEGDRVSSLALSPDGTRVLAGGLHTIKLWDATNGEPLRTFKWQGTTFDSLAFSPDGSRVAAGADDTTIKILNVATGALERTFEGHPGRIETVAFSRDGTRVLSASANEAALWELATGASRIFLGTRSAWINSIALSHDGTRVASGTRDGKILLWNASAGILDRTFEGHSGGVDTMEFSRDDSRVLSSGPDRRMKLWDATTGALLRTFEGDANWGVTVIGFSPDGSRLLSRGKDGLQVWDARTGTLLRTLGGRSASVSFSPDGTSVIFGESNWIKLLDIATGQVLREIKTDRGPGGVMFSPDGARFLALGSKSIDLWDAATGAFLRTFEGYVDWITSVVFSSDSQRMLSSTRDGTVRLSDVTTGALVRTFEAQSNRVNPVALSSDGTRVVSVARDGIKLWDTATGALVRTFEGRSPTGTSLAFLPDGTRVLSGFHSAFLWDATTGSLLRILHSDDWTKLAVSPDSRRIVSGTGVWDATTGEKLATFIARSDGEWLTLTAAGFFAASPKGAEMLTVVRGTEPFSVVPFYDQLHRPDLVEELLKGDAEGKYKDAARRITSERILETVSAPKPELSSAQTETNRETIDSSACKEGQNLDFQIRACSQLIESNAGDSVAYIHRSSAYIKNGDHDRAISDASRAIEIETSPESPNPAIAYNLRAWATFKAGKSAQGLSDVERALQLRPYDANFLDTRAHIQEALGRNEEAITSFRLALMRKGDLHEARNGLKRLGASPPEQAHIDFMLNLPHGGGVTSVAYSPDGMLAASGSRDGAVKLWEAATGRLIRTLEHLASVGSVVFSPEGARVLSGSTDGTAKLWDVATGDHLGTFPGGGGGSMEVAPLAFSADGKQIATGADGLRLWDVATGQVLRKIETQFFPYALAFSPDGSRLLSGNYGTRAQLWDVASGKLIRSFEGHESSVGSVIWAVAFSPDDTRVLSGSSRDGTARLWNASTGELLRTFGGHANGVRSVAFSPDGKRIVTGTGSGTARLWSAETGQLLHSFKGYSDWISSVTFSPDGERILLGSLDRTTPEVWDTTSGQLLQTFGRARARGRSVAFSPNGAYALAGVDSSLQLWDATTGRLLRKFEGHRDKVNSVAFSPDGSRALSGSADETLKLWDVATGQVLRTFEGHDGWVGSVAFSSDGTRVASGGEDKTLKIWDTGTGVLLHNLPTDEAIYSVAFSPDGRRVLLGTRYLELWDVATGQNQTWYVPGPSATVVHSVAFSPDGTRVVSGQDGPGQTTTLHMWDATTGQNVWAGSNIGVYSVAFSRDGKLLLSGSDEGIEVWEAATGKLLRTFVGHSRRIVSVALSPNETRVLSGNLDGMVHISDLGTGQLLSSLLGGADGEWLTITQKGFFAASRKGTEALNIVRRLEAYSVMQFYDHLHRPDLVEEVLKGDPEFKYVDASRRLNLEMILESGPAPRIELLPNRTEKTGETVKLAVRLIDEGGGIGPKVIWRVNGKTQGATTALGAGRPPSLGDYVVMPQALTVDPTKKNEIEIIGYNGRGWLATPPLRISVDAWGVATQERPRLFVLAMGVDNYLRPDWQLRYAAEDASAFAAALKAIGSEKVEGSPMFSNVELSTLLNEKVTERNIAAEFERMAAMVKARDVFVLFLGGHGRSFAGEGWFFVPQDFSLEKGHTMPKNLISHDRLRDWMAKIPAQKRLVILDACESGATETFRGGDRQRETVMAQLEHATGDSIISAAPGGKAAYEVSNLGHGVLTYTLLEALHRANGAPAEPVSVFGLAAHAMLQVPAISQREFAIRQIPRFTPTGEDFPLGVRTVILKETLAISTTPTHVNPEPLRVFKNAGGKDGVALQLPPFTPVTLIETKGGWGHIARAGTVLGYVPEGRLRKLAQPSAPQPISTVPAPKAPASKRARVPAAVKATKQPARPAKGSDRSASHLELRH
ncbi:caspase family protein [Bradyrhizobium sp. CW10]|uniref:WD40 domain-containing protein n=1 Tax=Bradyrhizobium sp. CW10 TaxID=2782683 RepID=UPI001FFA92FF|nr:caspase family protein [Bradyrhizobium sp. CW10]